MWESVAGRDGWRGVIVEVLGGGTVGEEGVKPIEKGVGDPGFFEVVDKSGV